MYKDIRGCGISANNVKKNTGMSSLIEVKSQLSENWNDVHSTRCNHKPGFISVKSTYDYYFLSLLSFSIYKEHVNRSLESVCPLSSIWYYKWLVVFLVL